MESYDSGFGSDYACPINLFYGGAGDSGDRSFSGLMGLV
jgi:hypothetical protein